MAEKQLFTTHMNRSKLSEVSRISDSEKNAMKRQPLNFNHLQNKKEDQNNLTTLLTFLLFLLLIVFTTLIYRS